MSIPELLNGYAAIYLFMSTLVTAGASVEDAHEAAVDLATSMSDDVTAVEFWCRALRAAAKEFSNANTEVEFAPVLLPMTGVAQA